MKTILVLFIVSYHVFMAESVCHECETKYDGNGEMYCEGTCHDSEQICMKMQVETGDGSIHVCRCALPTQPNMTTAMTTIPNVECENPGDGTCNNEPCGYPNTYCEEIYKGYEPAGCGCNYCYYDNGKCIGQCQDRVLSQCISKVAVPKSQSDCQCYTCQQHFDQYGILHCSGTCLESGLVCKLAYAPPIYWEYGNQDQPFCTCQPPDAPDQPLYDCRYIARIDRCAGICNYGGYCDYLGGSECYCPGHAMNGEQDVCRFSGGECVGVCYYGGECVRYGNDVNCFCDGEDGIRRTTADTTTTTDSSEQ